ncbi:hypothetical protein ACFL1X_06995 [Candidatus Hydrogenedentota bacterium]
MNTRIPLNSSPVILLCIALSLSFPAFSEESAQPDPVARARALEFEEKRFNEFPFAIHGFTVTQERKPLFAKTGAKWARAWEGVSDPSSPTYKEWFPRRHNRLDEWVTVHGECGAQTMPCVNTGRSRTLPASRRESWRKGLIEKVERYDGDGIDDMPGLKIPIKYWQFSNEWTWRWKGSQEDFIELWRISYECVKQADPEAKVVLGGMTGIGALALVDGYRGDDFIVYQGKAFGAEELPTIPEFQKQRAFIEAVLEQAAPYFDVISFHVYGGYQHIPGCVAWLRDKMEALGYSKPIITTEMGGPFIKGQDAYTEQTHCDAIVKYHAVSLTSGIDVIYWSTLNVLPEWGITYANTGLLDRHDKPKPGFYTYKLMVAKLGDMTTAIRVPVESWDTETRIYRFGTPDGPVYVMWSERIAGRHLEFPVQTAKVRVTDVAGNKAIIKTKNGKAIMELTDSPVFMESIPADSPVP